MNNLKTDELFNKFVDKLIENDEGIDIYEKRLKVLNCIIKNLNRDREIRIAQSLLNMLYLSNSDCVEVIPALSKTCSRIWSSYTNQDASANDIKFVRSILIMLNKSRK